MSNYYVKVFTDDSNEKEWEDLNPDEIHHIEFKGKRYDEVRHGRWEDYSDDGYYECSVCGEAWTFIDGTPKDNNANYCPRCGAKMDEVEEDE